MNQCLRQNVEPEGLPSVSVCDAFKVIHCVSEDVANNGKYTSNAASSNCLQAWHPCQLTAPLIATEAKSGASHCTRFFLLQNNHGANMFNCLIVTVCLRKIAAWHSFNYMYVKWWSPINYTSPCITEHRSNSCPMQWRNYLTINFHHFDYVICHSLRCWKRLRSTTEPCLMLHVTSYLLPSWADPSLCCAAGCLINVVINTFIIKTKSHCMVWIGWWSRFNITVSQLDEDYKGDVIQQTEFTIRLTTQP